MEAKEFGQDLTKAFDSWNRSGSSKEDVANLNKALEFAYTNGIDLVLEMPKGLLASKEGTTKPMYRGDAIEHSSSTSEHSIFFEIPSEMSMDKRGSSKKLTLNAVDEYRDLGSTLILNHKTNGQFGTFVPGEITSLRVK